MDDLRLSLKDALSLTDSLLALVDRSLDRTSAVPTRDRCEVILVAAYGRAYRCLRSIRETAARGEADDATVLVRALVALILRSLYIVQPEEQAERQRRLAQWVGKSRRDQRVMIEELRELEYEFTDEDVDRARELESATTWAGVLPSDKDLAKSVGLGQVYSHVYRLASDAAHYGIFTMLEGFEKQPETVTGEGASVSLVKSDPDRASDALAYGVVSYGAFLEKSEPVIGHGVTSAASALVSAYFADSEGP